MENKPTPPVSAEYKALAESANMPALFLGKLKNIKPGQRIWRCNKETYEIDQVPSIVIHKPDGSKSIDITTGPGYLYTLAVTRKKATQNFINRKLLKL